MITYRVIPHPANPGASPEKFWMVVAGGQQVSKLGTLPGTSVYVLVAIEQTEKEARELADKLGTFLLKDAVDRYEAARRTPSA